MTEMVWKMKNKMNFSVRASLVHQFDDLYRYIIPYDAVEGTRQSEGGERFDDEYDIDYHDNFGNNYHDEHSKGHHDNHGSQRHSKDNEDDEEDEEEEEDEEDELREDVSFYDDARNNGSVRTIV